MALGFVEERLFQEVILENFPKEKNLFSKDEVLFIISEMTQEDKYLNKKMKRATPHKIFKYFVRYCLYRNLANFDTLILLTGDKGVGKSSFAIMLAREWCRLLGISFSPDKYIAYTNKQMMDCIDNLDKFSPLIGDEGVNYCSTEGWNKVENKALKIKLAQIRTRHYFFILCFPMKITKVDKVYLDSFVNYWVDIFSRGKGALYVRSLSPSQESWRIKDFTGLGNYNEFTSAEAVAKKLSKHPNFWYLITAPKPSEQLYKRYLLVREQNVYNQNGALQNVSNQDIYRAALIMLFGDIMMRDSSISFKRVLIVLKSEYGLDVKEKELKIVMEDAKNLLKRVKEEGKREYLDESNTGARGNGGIIEESTTDL